MSQESTAPPPDGTPEPEPATDQPDPAASAEPASSAEPPSEEPAGAAAEPAGDEASGGEASAEATDGPPPEQRKRRLAQIVVGAAGAVILAVIGAVVVANQLGDDLPATGDCMSNHADPAEIRVVDCGSAEAAWTVVGLDGTWTEQEFDESPRHRVCQEIPKWDNALWLGEQTDDRSGEGTVVCLRATSPQ